MKESTSREKVLKKIRNALIYKSDNPFPDLDMESSVFQPMHEPLDITFAQELIQVSGTFVFCEHAEDFVATFKTMKQERNWQGIICLEKPIRDLLEKNGILLSGEDDLLQAKVGITFCEYLVARLGSVLVSSGQASGRRMVVFPDAHIVVAFTSQLKADLKQSIAAMKEKYNGKLPSMVSLITGPSRTADIEKTLVLGAHGPKELVVFLIDQPKQAT